MDAVRTILVATDFSKISDYALECAVELADVHDAKHITVLHAPRGLPYKHLGSVAEKILQGTTRPVIVVRPPHADM